ncbi:MAG: universal stress protein [Acidimicrobiales bacterium]
MAADVALLVITTHGRTGWQRLAVGSVASATIHIAPVPVLTIPGSSQEHLRT